MCSVVATTEIPVCTYLHSHDYTNYTEMLHDTIAARSLIINEGETESDEDCRARKSTYILLLYTH